MSSKPTIGLKEKLFLALGVPFFMLAVLEGTLRILDSPSWFRSEKVVLEMPAWMVQDENSVAKATTIAKDAADVDWWHIFEKGDGYRVRLKPNLDIEVTNTFSQVKGDPDRIYKIRSNSDGFRSDELEKIVPNETIRILLFGDSSSFGWGVNQKDIFTESLRKKLGQKTGKKIEIGNFAMPGDSSAYGKLLFDKTIEKYEADYVILGFGANDSKKVLKSHTEQIQRYGEKSSLLQLTSLVQHSYIFKTMQAAIQAQKNKEAKDLSKRNAVSKKYYRKNLTHMAEKSLSSGAKGVLLLNLCTPGHYSKVAAKLSKRKEFEYFNGQAYLFKMLPEIISGKILPEYVSEMQEHYPDTLKSGARFYVTSDACHPNKLGHKLIGEKIASILTSTGQL